MPRAPESFAARRPGRTDLGTAPCASPRRRRPFPAAPGLVPPGQPSSPAPGRGGPRGLLFGKSWWRLQRNALPTRWRAGRRRGVHRRCHQSEFGGPGRGSAPRAGVRGRFEIWWIGAACGCEGGCEGAQVLWGGGLAAPPPTVTDSLSAGAQFRSLANCVSGQRELRGLAACCTLLGPPLQPERPPLPALHLVFQQRWTVSLLAVVDDAGPPAWLSHRHPLPD